MAEQPESTPSPIDAPSSDAATFPERLAALDALTLKSGAHGSLDEGGCAIELVSYLAGEPWSDHPACVCPVLGAFFRNWNDGLPSDEDRDRLLKPFLPRLIGTNDGRSGERADLIWEWTWKVSTPAWLRVAGLTELAEMLETATAETLDDRLLSARKGAAAARDAAWDAAGDAAGAAARDAAWDAAGDAARAAAGDAARAAARAAAGAAAGAAAWAAAWAAAGAAAWAAAGAAAGAAAWAALRPTVESLQASAVLLVERCLTLPAQEVR